MTYCTAGESTPSGLCRVWGVRPHCGLPLPSRVSHPAPSPVASFPVASLLRAQIPHRAPGTRTLSLFAAFRRRQPS